MAHPRSPANAASGFGSGSKLRALWLPALLCLLLLTGEVYVLFHDLGANSKTQGSGVPIATFESGKNQVRQKSGGTIMWQKPSSGQTIYQQDAIATMADSEATVRFPDHSEMTIEPNTLIVFEEAEFGKPGTAGKIVARLVRGSIRRKNSGPMNFLIRFSKNAPPVPLLDSAGDAVFRVVYRTHGIEVTVESGGIRSEGRAIGPHQKLTVHNGAIQVGPATEQKLPSPTLRKPRIEIRQLKSEFSPPRWIDAFSFFPEAFAAPPTKPRWLISIHFSWNAVPGAQGYRIQISKDPEFRKVILDQAVSGTEFDYQSDLPPKPQTLYMRVAGQDASGAVGQFSALEKIRIQSVSEISREMLPSARPSLRPRKLHLSRKKHARRPPRLPHRWPKPHYPQRRPPNQAPAKKRAASTDRSRIDVSYGIVFQHRQFKSSQLPSNATASGFVPAQIGAEYSRISRRGRGFKVGASSLFEVAKAGSSGATIQNGEIGVPVLRAWALYEREFKVWTGGIGPYLASSSALSWSGSSLTSETKLLEGVLIDGTTRRYGLLWRGDLGVLALGGMGVDFSVSARKSVFKNQGIFGEVTLESRFISLEDSYGGAIAVGKSF